MLMNFIHDVMPMLFLADETAITGIRPDWYFPIRLTLIIIISILALFILLVVLLQPGNSEGLGAITGSSADTYLGKNKAKSWEGKLKRLTVIAAVLIIGLSIVFGWLGTLTF